MKFSDTELVMLGYRGLSLNNEDDFKLFESILNCVLFGETEFVGLTPVEFSINIFNYYFVELELWEKEGSPPDRDPKNQRIETLIQNHRVMYSDQCLPEIRAARVI